MKRPRIKKPAGTSKSRLSKRNVLDCQKEKMEKLLKATK